MNQIHTNLVFEMISDMQHNRDELPALVNAEESSLDSSVIQNDSRSTNSQNASCDGTSSSAVIEEDNSKHRQDLLCDACPYCDDTCGNPNCIECDKKMKSKSTSNIRRSGSLLDLLGFEFDFSLPEQKSYTMCQIRRHASKESAWLVVGNCVYDVTTYIDIHPGGERSILRKSGGAADCRKDMGFHSDKARKLWKKHFIGTIKQCPCSHACH